MCESLELILDTSYSIKYTLAVAVDSSIARLTPDCINDSENKMTATIKVKPGQKGTKSLVAKYGDALLCVRYRYNSKTQKRIKTVELIVEEKPWLPSLHQFEDDTPVPVRIGYRDAELREMAKAAKGKWDPEKRLWYIKFGRIKNTELAKFIVS